MFKPTHHSDFIESLAFIYKPKVYVELGLYEGETINKVSKWCSECHGVDMSISKVGQVSGNTKLYECATNDFFKSWDKKIDMAFIDADHNYLSALCDFENVFKNLNKGGIIILHDTDPINEYYKSPNLCGDSYKIVPILEKDPRVNIVTIPMCEPGLSIVTKKGDSRN